MSPSEDPARVCWPSAQLRIVSRTANMGELLRVRGDILSSVRGLCTPPIMGLRNRKQIVQKAKSQIQME